jgi:hypothetical protein
MSEHFSGGVCEVEGCPYQETISNLNKTVYIGNGSPALTVQIGNLATKIDTTRNLILAEVVIIPVLIGLIELGMKIWRP